MLCVCVCVCVCVFFKVLAAQDRMYHKKVIIFKLFNIT